MAREKATTQSGTFSLNESGSQERRKRLSGALDAASGQRILELLQDKSLYGSIIVTDGTTDVSFFFTRGGLRVLALGRSLPSLADRLLAQGKIDKAQHAKAREAMAARKAGDRRDEREVLVDTMHVATQTVDDASREVITEAFLDCLFWDSPQFEASTGEPEAEATQRRDVSAVTLSLGVKDLVTSLIARVRQLGDLRRTVSSMQVTVEPQTKAREAASQGGKVGDGPQAEARTRVLRKVVAEPGLRAGALARQLGLGEHELASHLHELVTQGFVKLDRPPPNKVEDLARLRSMEENIDQTLSQLVRRLRVAQEAIHVGDNVRAGRHLAGAGGMLLRDGRDDEAVKTLQSAVQLAPENLEGREGYVQGLWATNRMPEAVAESEELGRRYLTLNLPGRAKRVLERALQRDERTASLHLLVKSLVKLRQPKAAAEAGERLVNRLRREGKANEARLVAAELFELATDADKQRLLRAAGADRRAVVGLLAVSMVLAVAFFPASQAHAQRAEYEKAAREATVLLTSERDLARLGASVMAVRQTFEALAERPGEVGDEAKKVVAQLEKLATDVARLERLRTYFPWQSTTDLEFALKQFEAVRPETVALAKPLRQLISDVKTFRGRADEVRQTLLRTEPGAEAMAAALKAREEFKGLPAQLERMVVRVRLDSAPTGAQVKWDGVEYSQPTPLVIGVPLLGEKVLELDRAGFQPLSRNLDFDGLKGKPEISFKLEPMRAAPPARPPAPPPTSTDTPRPPPDGTRPSGVTSTAPPPAERPRAQIEFRDGGFEGEPDLRFRFDQDADYIEDYQLQQRFRVIVQTVNEVEGGLAIYLVGARVYLEVLRSDGWRAEKPYVHEFDKRHQRPVVAEPGGRYKVQHVDRCLHMEKGWMQEQLREAIDQALRLNMIRENDARRGGR